MHEIDIKNWTHFEAEIDKLEGEWIFRGQSNYSWELASSIQRFFIDADIITKKKVQSTEIMLKRMSLMNFLRMHLYL